MASAAAPACPPARRCRRLPASIAFARPAGSRVMVRGSRVHDGSRLALDAQDRHAAAGAVPWLPTRCPAGAPLRGGRDPSRRRVRRLAGGTALAGTTGRSSIGTHRAACHGGRVPAAPVSIGGHPGDWQRRTRPHWRSVGQPLTGQVPHGALLSPGRRGRSRRCHCRCGRGVERQRRLMRLRLPARDPCQHPSATSAGRSCRSPRPAPCRSSWTVIVGRPHGLEHSSS